jgi:hypothetical protein
MTTRDKEVLSVHIRELGEEVRDAMTRLQVRSILLPNRRVIVRHNGSTSEGEFDRLALEAPTSEYAKPNRVLGEFEEEVGDEGGFCGWLHHDPNYKRYRLSVEAAQFVLDHQDHIETVLAQRARVLKQQIEELCDTS